FREGKRQQYVPPVKLYIFISFITFLLINLVPKSPIDKKIDEKSKNEIETQPAKRDTVLLVNKKYARFEDLKKDYEAGNVNFFLYHAGKATFHIWEHDLDEEKLNYAFVKTIPKAIFLYMPVFSFWIWLLHGKRRWYFFDHGIFTLHYFSFLLLSFTIYFLITRAISWTVPNENIVEAVTGLLSFILMGYMVFYFFRSHRRMYGESRAVSRLKSIALFFINM